MNQADDSGLEKHRRWDLYTEHVKQAWQDIQSSTDSFDQSLLAVSSGALGVSLAFIKDIIPLKEAIELRFLFASWFAFTACIVVTIFSFQLSILAQEQHLKYLRRYYVDGEKEYLNKKELVFESVDGLHVARSDLVAFGPDLHDDILCYEHLPKVGLEVSMPEKPKGSSRAFDGRQPVALTPNPGTEERGRQPVSVTPTPTPAPQPVKGETLHLDSLHGGRQLMQMTPLDKVEKPGPGDAQKGRQPVTVTPAPVQTPPSNPAPAKTPDNK